MTDIQPPPIQQPMLVSLTGLPAQPWVYWFNLIRNAISECCNDGNNGSDGVLDGGERLVLDGFLDGGTRIA